MRMGLRATLGRVLLSSLALAAGNNSSCGAGKGVKDCEHIDFGSCGGACCVVDYEIGAREVALDMTDASRLLSSPLASHESGLATVNTTHVYLQVKGYLAKGGKDGSYAYVTGPDSAGHNPSDDLTRAPSLSWDYIFEGRHTTSGGYVDTLKFNIARVKPGHATIMRIFSVSDVHGALGDNGQNYKNIAYILEGRGAKIVYGCGT